MHYVLFAIRWVHATWAKSFYFERSVADAIGRTNWNNAPFLPSDDAVRWPPCCSMIMRQIASPNPIPCDLVVTNAVNMRSNFSGSIPGPDVFYCDRNGIASREAPLSPAVSDFDQSCCPLLQSRCEPS